MKKTSKRLIVSMLTLVLTVVALGTTTFAWFTLSNVATVSTIEGNITGGAGMEIQLQSLDGTTASTTWKSNITSGDMKSFLGDLLEVGFEFDAVTTTDGTTFKMLQQITETGNDYGKLALTATPVANKDYIEFKVNFRSQTEGTIALNNLAIDSPQTQTFTPDGDDYVQVAEEGPSSHDVVTSAAYAARVFVENTAYQYGEGDPIKVDNDQVVGNTVMEEAGIVAGQWSYLASKGLEFVDDIHSNHELLKALTAVKDGDDFNTTKVLVKNGDFYETSMTVRIWIEGFDADTYDSVFNSTLQVNLGFEKIATPVGP